MKKSNLIYLITVCLAICIMGCTSTTNKEKVECKVFAQLTLPYSSDDPANLKEQFKDRFEKQYVPSIKLAIERNKLDVGVDKFEYELKDIGDSGRVMHFYLSSFTDCNCENLLDTLLAEIHSGFSESYPDPRMIECEKEIEALTKEIDVLEAKIESIKTPQEIAEHNINVNTIEKWDKEWTELQQKREELQIEKASFSNEFFKVLDSGPLTLQVQNN